MCDRRGQGGGGPRRSDARRSREEEGTTRIRMSASDGAGRRRAPPLRSTRHPGRRRGTARLGRPARAREEEGPAGLIYVRTPGRRRGRPVFEFLRATGQGGGSPAALWSACAPREEEKRPWCATGEGQGGGGPGRSDLRARPREEEGAARISVFVKATASGRRRCRRLVADRPGRRRGDAAARDRFREEEEPVGKRETYLASEASIATRLIIERLRPRSARSRSLSACSSL